jgi:hypothetical protein
MNEERMGGAGRIVPPVGPRNAVKSVSVQDLLGCQSEGSSLAWEKGVWLAVPAYAEASARRANSDDEDHG